MKDKRGYIHVWLSADDFFYPMAATNGYVFEHRLVVAQTLGRCLHPWEVVHHINRVRDDNRPKNLMLISELANRQIAYFEGRLRRLIAENKRLRERVRDAEKKSTQKG